MAGLTGVLSAAAVAPIALVAAALAIAVFGFATLGASHIPDGPSAGATDSAVSETSLINAMRDPAILFGDDLSALQFNAAASALLPALRAAVPLEYLHRDPDLAAAARATLADGVSRSVSLVLRGAGERHVELALGRVAGGEGAPAVLITIRDLSEQVRLLEMRSDFIANASHELRTPLASLRGFIETLQGPARNDEKARERFLGVMAGQAERMTRLIDDLLLLSRVEERANLPPTGHADVAAIIADVQRTIEPIVHERSAVLDCGPVPAGISIAGDRDELYQVYQNIIENAVKYGPEGGRVRVAHRIIQIPREADFVFELETSVSDEGPGIPPEHLPRLTERFYRVNTNHSRSIGGTGLGLAIVKHILQRHGGRLQVDSVVGRGSNFRVVLPATKTAAMSGS